MLILSELVCVMRIVIDDVPESLNKVLRMHWAVRKRYNDKWYALVRSQIVPRRRKPKGKMVVFISLMRKRLLDKDNLYGSCKVIVDGIKQLDLIVDDDPKHLDLHCTQMTGKTKATIIIIEEAQHEQ